MPTTHPHPVLPIPSTPAEWARRTEPWSPYTPLPANALDVAIQYRTDGATNAAILHRLTCEGWDTRGYSTTLLNHQVRARMQRRGMPLPTRRARRSTARVAAAARRRGGPLGTARTFGVEIECQGIRPEEAARALRAAGVAAHAEGYNHRVQDYWKCTTDASVYGGTEVVSPVLTDTAEVVVVMRALREAGANVDETACGLHVHHDATDLGGGGVAEVIRTFRRLQPAMDGLVAPSRRGGRATYCHPLSDREADDWSRRYEGVTATARGTMLAESTRALGLRTAQDGRHTPNRYRTLNVWTFPIQGTVEFRQHQGTLSGAKAEAWIAFGRAVLDAVAAGAEVRAATMLADLVAAGTLEQTTADFLTRRAAILASRT